MSGQSQADVGGRRTAMREFMVFLAVFAVAGLITLAFVV